MHCGAPVAGRHGAPVADLNRPWGARQTRAEVPGAMRSLVAVIALRPEGAELCIDLHGDPACIPAMLDGSQGWASGR